MADPVFRLTSGDEHFDLAGLMSDEMAQVKAWTSLKNRQEFYAALREEDPDAVTAAFSLTRWRNTGEKPRWSDVRVNLDALVWTRHIDGRDVEVIAEQDPDGGLLLVQVDRRTGKPLKDEHGYILPTGADDEKVGIAPHFTDDGDLRWKFTDTGEEVRPTTQPATSGTTGSRTTAKKLPVSVSDSGTPTTDAA